MQTSGGCSTTWNLFFKNLMSHALFLFCSLNKCMYKKNRLCGKIVTMYLLWLEVKDKVKNVDMSDLLVL
jgi:hypothetical protein